MANIDQTITNEITSLNKEIKKSGEYLEREKQKFITELKTGLGEELKRNTNRVKIVKKTKLQRLKSFFIKIFTKF
jgi:hypothetical protein